MFHEKGKFFVEDGHHRLYAAIILKKPLKINLEIKDNPIVKLGGDLGYDDFHRCVFKQVKTSGKLNISKEPLEEIERRESWKKEIEQVAKQLNVPLTNYLGSGVWGIAYEIPGNKVLKITEDEREVNNAKHLVGKKNKLLADIYKVYSIKGNKDKKVIIMEKLAPLDKKYSKALSEFEDAFSDYSNPESSWTEMLSDGWDKGFNDFLEERGLGDIYSELLAIYEEAISKGIYLSDMHQGNMGLKNGYLALFDIT